MPYIKLVEAFTLVGAGLSLVCCLAIRALAGGLLLLRYFNGVVWHHRDLQGSQYVVSVEFPSLITIGLNNYLSVICLFPVIIH